MARYQIDNVASPIDFQGRERVRRTLQNAKNLLLCRRGEVPYDRYRGFDARLFDLPMTELRARLLPELDRIMIWEPEAQVVSAEATLTENGVYIRAIIEVMEE